MRSKQWNKPDPEKGHYESPLVPYLPCFAIYVNFLLSWEPKLWVQMQMLLLTVIGLVIYFVYRCLPEFGGNISTRFRGESRNLQLCVRLLHRVSF